MEEERKRKRPPGARRPAVAVAYLRYCVAGWRNILLFRY